MAVYPFKKDFYFFEIYFCAFLFLSFWLDFVVTISFYDYFFSEGFGSFDFSKKSLDDVLFISSLVCFSIILSMIVRRKIFYSKKKNC